MVDETFPHVTRRAFMTLTGAVLAGTALAAAAPGLAVGGQKPAAKVPKKGGVIKVAIIGEPPALDPGFTTATITQNTMWHVFEGLFARNSKFEPVPHLAERYDVNPEGTRFVFHLRKGVPFHNDQEFTSADAAASLKRWAVVAGRGRLIFNRVDTVEETDRYTLTVTFKEPTGLFPLFISEAESMMLPKDIADKAGKNRLTDDMVIGTGPYKMVEHRVDRYIRLQRWEKYAPREAPPDGPSGKRLAYFDEIMFIPVPEASVRADGVVTGEYHFTESLEPDQYANLSASPGVQALIVKPYYQYGPHFNKKQGMFLDARLRRAALVAVDLEQIMIAGFGRKEFFRLGPEIAAPETAWYSDVGREAYTYDPELARKLMQEAGYKGEPVRWIATREYFYNYNMALAFKDQLEKVGFKIDLQVMDWATLVSTRSKAEMYEIFLTGHPTYVHPIRQVYLDGTWPGWWTAEKKNQIVSRMLAEPDLEKQKQLVRELQQFQWEDVPWIKCGEAFTLRAMRDEIVAYENPTDWYLWNCGFAA
ncbi:MAG TPA: ABC transporter substrate-binding protein [Alphaproteobacteria bacterium]|nr:ABC transporter substrate-binding protein [Alphaproteobacteria bacterium]